MAKSFYLVKNVFALSLLDDVSKQRPHSSHIVPELSIARDNLANGFPLRGEQCRIRLEE
jgi:hypothetical protein